MAHTHLGVSPPFVDALLCASPPPFCHHGQRLSCFCLAPACCLTCRVSHDGQSSVLGLLVVTFGASSWHHADRRYRFCAVCLACWRVLAACHAGTFVCPSAALAGRLGYRGHRVVEVPLVGLWCQGRLGLTERATCPTIASVRALQPQSLHLPQ